MNAQEKKDINVAITLLSMLAIPLRIAALFFMWGWFIVPLGVRDITFIHAAGLAYTGKLLMWHDISLTKRTQDERLERAIYSVMIPLTALLIGAILKVAM